jgi:Icc-related predicted phosphoesterase
MTSVRVAAVGDIHVGLDSPPVLFPEALADSADVLLLAGDLTRRGTAAEAEVLAAQLAMVPVPVVIVLGNHDYESDAADEVRAVMQAAGATVLDGDSVLVDVGGVSIGIAGTPGFGGGFPGASASEFGEPLMKAFVRHTRTMAQALCQALASLDSDVRIALTHYSPIEATLEGERREIFPFLGSYLLAEAIDSGGAHLAVHGHAHRGARGGATPCGVPVRNVAQPVIGRPFTVLCLDPDSLAHEHLA